MRYNKRPSSIWVSLSSVRWISIQIREQIEIVIDARVGAQSNYMLA
jgi:hypothetical protein